MSVDFNTKFLCGDTMATCSVNTIGPQTIPDLEDEVIKSLTTFYGNQTDANHTAVSGKIARLKSAVSKLTPDSNNPTRDTNALKIYHNEILKNRNELDIKMKEINRSQDSVYSMYKAKYDSTMYSSIIWTILATSLIYYIFVKL